MVRIRQLTRKRYVKPRPFVLFTLLLIFHNNSIKPLNIKKKTLPLAYRSEKKRGFLLEYRVLDQEFLFSQISPLTFCKSLISLHRLQNCLPRIVLRWVPCYIFHFCTSGQCGAKKERLERESSFRLMHGTSRVLPMNTLDLVLALFSFFAHSHKPRAWNWNRLTSFTPIRVLLAPLFIPNK